MDVTAEDFRRHYESLSDAALLEIDTGELVALARTCHAEEVAKRGLDSGGGEEEEAAGSGDRLPGSEAVAEEPVCIAEYDDFDEADLARGMLEAGEIPATLESEPGAVRLMVAPGLAEQALRMLAMTPLSDEELAAQAEAAGLEEGEELEGEEDSDA